jgi:hypothetical protein
MTKSAARRAIAGGRNARVFDQTAPTNLKSLNHKPRTSAEHGAGPFIYRNTDAKRLTDFQTDGFASRY